MTRRDPGDTGSWDRSRGPGRPRDDAIDGRILAATVALVDADETPTVARIVETSGVSRAALYRRWPSVTTLVAAAVDVGRTAPEPIPTDGDLRAAVRRSILTTAAAVEPGGYPGERFRQRIRLAMEDRDLQRAYWETHVSRRRGPLEEALRAGIAGGLLRADLDVAACIDLLSGVFYYQFVVRGSELGDPGVAERCGHAFDVVWAGMLAHGSDPDTEAAR